MNYCLEDPFPLKCLKCFELFIGNKYNSVIINSYSIFLIELWILLFACFCINKGLVFLNNNFFLLQKNIYPSSSTPRLYSNYL